MHRIIQGLRRWIGAAVVLGLAGVLVGCGGGGGDAGTTPPQSCSVASQQSWLRDYMDDWYFWYADSPRPNAAQFGTVAGYFEAILSPGRSPDFPPDRWSRSESTESFNRFFGDGATLGYGVSVAGLEVTGQPQRPLYVRWVEALSPAAAAGVLRGDEVLAINSRSAADIIASDDYSLLSPLAAGENITLRLRRAGQERSVVLTAAVFALTPVNGAAVVTSPSGRKLGYVVVKDMISQALTPLDMAFANFRSAGVQDVVLDLRYNGGGLVSTGATVASYVAGSRSAGRTYAKLLYNDKRAAANNQSYAFSTPAAGLGLSRAIVLMGPRTCSASEQVINGLLGAGIEVLAVGDTTCGKPVGFLPTNACGQTYSVVNFEGVNALNQGRYFDGLDPTCPVAEDFTAPLGAAADPLWAAAVQLADHGTCPVTARASGTARALGMPYRRLIGARVEAGERQGMIPR
jgi:carboxyl-terminal processing protease